MFGQKPLFGGTSSSIFGQQTQSTQNIFGTTNPTQAVVPFGQQPQPSATPSLFGQQQPTLNNPSTNLFQPQTPGTSAFSFGQTPNAQTTPSFFGGASTVTSNVGFPSAPQQTPSFFGGASTGGGLFGMATAPQTAGTTIKFKAPTAQDTMYRNGISQNVTIGIQCISAMKEYENKSLEELRLEDYMANRKTATVTGLGLGSTPFQLGQTGSSLFGGTPQSSTTTNIFGVNSNPSIFGASSSSFLTSTTPSLFGAAQPSATPSLFGQQTSQPTAVATPFQFGVTPQVASNAPSLFGTGAAKPALFSGFGQPTAPAISTTPGFSFNFGSTVVSTSSSAVPGGFFGGQPTVVSSTTPSFFGATPALGSNLFGQPVASSTPSLFGFPSAVSTNAPPSLFGGQQPQQTSTGGGFSFFGGGNIPGQASAPSAPTGGGSTFNFFGSSSAVITTTSTQAAPSFGAFGFGAATAGSGGAFGFPAKTTSSAAAPTGFSFFGAPSQTSAVVNTTTPSLFGFGGGPSSVFGAPQTQLGTAPSFGAATTSAGGQFSLFQMPSAAPSAVSAPNLFGGGGGFPSAPGFNMAAPISSTPAPSLFGFGTNQTPAFGSFGGTGNTNNPFNFGNSSIQPTGFGGSSLFGQSLATQQASAPSSGLFVQSQPTQTPQITQSNYTGSLIPSSLSAQTFQNVFSDPTGPLRKQILDLVNLMPYGDVPLGNSSLFLQDSGRVQKSSPSHLPSLFDNNVVDNQKTSNTSSLKGDSIDGRKSSVLFSGLIPTQLGAMRYTPNNKFSLPTFGFESSPKRNSPFLSTSPLRSNSFRLKELFKETPPSPSKENGKIRNFDLNDQSIAIIPRNKSANKSSLNASLLFPSTPFNLFGSGQKNASFIPQHSNLNNVEQNSNGRNLKKLNVKAGAYISPKTIGNFAFSQRSLNFNGLTTMDFKTSPSKRIFNIEDNPSHLSLSTPGVSRYQSLYPKLTVPDSVFSVDSTDSNALFSSFHQEQSLENIDNRDLSFISTRDNLSGPSEHDGPSFEQHQKNQFAQINSNTIELFHPSMVEDYYQSNNFYSEDEGEFQLISSDSENESPKKRSGKTQKTATPGKLQNFSGSNSSLQNRNHQESSLNVNSLLKKLAFERPLFKCTKPGYTTAPSVEECYEMYLNNLRKTIIDFYDNDPDMVDKARSRLMINNFTIERKGYGSIMFPGEINVIGLNIDRNVLIDVKDVEIYPDEVEKPILGEEMNRPALITLHNTYPIDKSTLQPIKELDKIIDFNYEKRLRIACKKMGVKFIDYIPHTGTWMFEVSHF